MKTLVYLSFALMFFNPSAGWWMFLILLATLIGGGVSAGKHGSGSGSEAPREEQLG